VSRPQHPVDRLLAGLVVLPVLVVVAVGAAPEVVPITALMVPLLLGSLVLSPRRLPWFVGWVMLALAVSLLLQDSVSARTWGAVGIQVLMGLIVLAFSLRRSRLGVAGVTGESMFVDLRDSILAQGGIPDLPSDWHVQRALRSAGGTPFAGDFLVATCPAPDRLEIAVVDVSGKGEDAGTRALLLSGVFGGLLGALPPEQFLPAANDYLVRQDWAEGFATAVHLSLTLTDGSYAVRSAGHPPAVVLVEGERRVLDAGGPVLGLIPDAEFTVATGRLAEPGATMLLYTDGMVERPDRDLDQGVERLQEEGERLLAAGVGDVAERLVEALGSRDDDRAMVVVSRRQRSGR
jgi:hypothetical protein